MSNIKAILMYQRVDISGYTIWLIAFKGHERCNGGWSGGGITYITINNVSTTLKFKFLMVL